MKKRLVGQQALRFPKSNTRIENSTSNNKENIKASSCSKVAETEHSGQADEKYQEGINSAVLNK